MNYHENNPKFTYFRFPIRGLDACPFRAETNEEALKHMIPVLNLIEEVTGKGKHVLIHCMDGAHRAGTTACAWIIFKGEGKISAKEAIDQAKKKRPQIEPIRDLKDLLV